MADTAQQSAAHTTSDPNTWVEQYGDYLYRFAITRVRDANLAEEVVQETLVAALEARSRFQGKSSERSWLTGILKHKIIDHFRKTAREQPTENIEAWTEETAEPFDEGGHWRVFDGEGPKDWGNDAASSLQQQEFFAVLQQCLSKLPSRIAQVFTLREIEEQTTEEICKTLAISSTNLWVILHRARVQLRQCLEMRWFERKSSDG